MTGPTTGRDDEIVVDDQCPITMRRCDRPCGAECIRGMFAAPAAVADNAGEVCASPVCDYPDHGWRPAAATALVGRDRYAQCDDTCTVDCGACKGQGRPAASPGVQADEWDHTAPAEPDDGPDYDADDDGRTEASSQMECDIAEVIHQAGLTWSRSLDTATAILDLLAAPTGRGDDGAVRPGLNAESNGRRLRWFTDDELAVELTRRAAVAGGQDGPSC